jgi:hypothetical protein
MDNKRRVAIDKENEMRGNKRASQKVRRIM